MKGVGLEGISLASIEECYASVRRQSYATSMQAEMEASRYINADGFASHPFNTGLTAPSASNGKRP